MQGTILVVDDDIDTAALLAEALQRRGFETQPVHSASECLRHLGRHRCDLVITDVKMDEMSGIELCERLRQQHPGVLSIVVTGEGGLSTAVDAIRAGAYDFVTKPVKVDALAIAVMRAFEHLSLRGELKRLREASGNDVAMGGIAGSSPAIRRTVEMVARVADSDATILITGESGTGKELVARALHDQSSRRDRPFIAVNCAAMPGPLLESELFGHARGAFTDAHQARRGLFVQAQDGTIFLDEIGEMPLEMQVKLLRVLQERSIRPVGEDSEIAINARVITATNRDLDIEVARKRFREDLFYRINVVPIAVPPLRERPSDILFLAQHFLRRIAERGHRRVPGISTGAARKLMRYDWPGNVRELENCMERASALSRHDDIRVDDLPPRLVNHDAAGLVIATSSLEELITIEDMGHRYVRRVMGLVGGNKTHAARVLGIDRRSLYRRLDAAHKSAADIAPPGADLVPRGDGNVAASASEL